MAYTIIHTPSPAVKPLYRGAQIVWYLLGILETLLAFRLILKLLAANPTAGFSSFLYALTQPLVSPFMSVFGITVVEGAVFEWSTLLAMLVYYLIGWAIIRLFIMGKPVSSEEAAHRLEHEEIE